MIYRPEYVSSNVSHSLLQRLNTYSFEVGPIRPPSEAYSLLIRATRNCPWNRCEFCSTYKGQKFQLRTVEEIKKDIETARAISDEMKAIAWRMGYGDRIREIAALVADKYPASPGVQNVALWLYGARGSVFLQDANSLIMRTPELVQVLTFLRATFPGLERITSYARAKTAAKKSREELKELCDAGLSRIHIGLESGGDEVLSFVQKGVTAAEHIEGGRKVVEAGMELSEYVMPGLGGRKWSREHVEGTARVLNAVDPAFIRIRTLHVAPNMLLWEKLEGGEFELLTEDEMVAEIGALIERLECHSTFASDHMMNLLQEVEGKLPDDKPKMLAPINEYLSLPPNERLVFRFGRRAGWFVRLSDLRDAYKRQRVEQAMRNLKLETGENVETAISQLRRRFI